MKTLQLDKLLKMWRHSLRISQADAANILGRSIGTYRDWEQGRCKPRGQTLNNVLAQIATSANAKR